jgi:hypothetical protein
MHKVDLIKHKRSVHVDKIIEMESTCEKNASKPYSCPHCHRGFTSTFARNRHLKTFCIALKAESGPETSEPDSSVNDQAL